MKFISPKALEGFKPLRSLITPSCSGLNQHDASSFKKWETELQIMIIDNRKVYKFKFAWFPIFPIY